MCWAIQISEATEGAANIIVQKKRKREGKSESEEGLFQLSCQHLFDSMMMEKREVEEKKKKAKKWMDPCLKFMDDGYEWVKRNGIARECDYPYTGRVPNIKHKKVMFVYQVCMYYVRVFD